jgi:hypothetical protein
MKNTLLATLSPLCLCLLAANARAALEPWSFGASEELQHQSNIGHTDGGGTADWISTTEFNAALHQALGRDALVASATLDINRYKVSKPLNSTGYRGAAEFDWNTVGDLSGAFGADTQRRQYISGEQADLSLSSGGQNPNQVHNLQTDSHAFIRGMLGGESRWQIYGGADANDRRYSNDSFNVNDERQWSANGGTRYATSPDLSFGLSGTYVHGEYPHAQTLVNDVLTEQADHFSTRAGDLNVKWQASGSSLLDASVGYTKEDSQALANPLHFVNAALNWTWTPPSHFTVNLGVRRSSDADSSTAPVNVGVVTGNNLNGTSINNMAHLEVVYSVTAKTSLDASVDYTQRKYSDALVIVPATATVAVSQNAVSGSTRTTRFFLTAHFQPTRTTDLSCGGGRETRHADASLGNFASGYSDNYLQCIAAIHFD